MWALSLSVVLLGLTSEVRADRAPDWLESYRAPSACPSASSFHEQVELRLSRELAALDRVRVSVAIARDDSSDERRWRSALTIGERALPATSTEVADSSCAALVEALALLVALRVDGSPEPAPPAFLPAAPDEAELALPSDARVAPPAWPSGSKPFRVGATVLGSVRSPLGPEPALGVGVGITLQWAQGGVWAPRLEISASRLATRDVALTGETAMRFDALLANASVCPLRGLGTDALWLRPCLDLEAGQLTGRGSGRSLVRAEARRAPWLAPGASLRAAIIPFGGPIQVSAGFGATFPSFRHEFFFSPNIEGFSVPRAGWNGSGQAAWLF